MKKLIIPITIILLLLGIGCYWIVTEYDKVKIRRENEEFLDSVSDKPLADDELRYEAESVLLGVDKNAKVIKLMSLSDNKAYELNYDGTTNFYGKHGNSLSVDQVKIGEAVKADYSIHSGKLLNMTVSGTAWRRTDVKNFEIDNKKDAITIGDETYKIDDNLVISYGDKLVELIDVESTDSVTVIGYDRKVVSIIVDTGHGYLRLVNDPYFVGGWIEIGQEIITKVTEDMLIPVPEGSYHVRLTNRGYQCEEDVTITRDEETQIDLKKANIEEVAVGHVQFVINPEYAQLFIDDVITEFDERVALEYGVHKVHIELSGYLDVDTNIKVSEPYADVEIDMELDTGDEDKDNEEDDDDKEKSDTSESDSDVTPTPSPTLTPTPTPAEGPGSAQWPAPTVPTPFPINDTGDKTSANASGTTVTPSPTATPAPTTTPLPTAIPAPTTTPAGNSVVIGGNKKMYIDSPAGVEVYVDGKYIGVAPVSSDVVKGKHSVTLQKEGFDSRTYTISIAEEDKDVTFSFSELIAQ